MSYSGCENASYNIQCLLPITVSCLGRVSRCPPRLAALHERREVSATTAEEIMSEPSPGRGETLYRPAATREGTGYNGVHEHYT